MQRNVQVAIGLASALTLALGGAAAASGSSGRSSHPTIHVIEHAITDTEFSASELATPGGPVAEGVHPANLLVFHNPLFDQANSRQVGRDQGDCIRIEVSDTVRSWECRWTNFLQGGEIMVEGPFSELPNQQTALAVTGGTGIFSDARGQMILKGNADETQFDFIFQLTSVTPSADR